MSTVQEIEGLFDREAPEYDAIVSGNGWPANDMLREELANMERVDNALDLGAGTGLTSAVELDAANPRCVIAVDISAGMLELLRSRCGYHPRLVVARVAIDQFLAGAHAKISSAEIRSRQHDRHNSSLGRATAKRRISQFQPGAYAKFDLVTAIALLHFLPNPQDVMAGVARVLSPDGRFIFTYDPYIPGHPTNGEKETMYDVNVYRNTPEEIESDLRQSGLEVVRDEPFAPKPNRDDAYQARFVVARRASCISPGVMG